jgi:hypothetical protein
LPEPAVPMINARGTFFSLRSTSDISKSNNLSVTMPEN